MNKLKDLLGKTVNDVLIESEELDSVKFNEEFTKNKNKEYMIEQVDYLLNEIIDNYNPVVMKDNDQIFLYYRGYYHIDGDKDIRSICGRFFGKYYSDSYKESIISKIKAFRTINRKNFVEEGEFLNVRNGVLNLRTLEKLDHDPKYNFMYRLDVDYNKDISYSKVKDYLIETLQTEDDILCLQEFIGYTLYPTYHLYDLDKLLIITGITGHNRKTKTCNLITKFLGDDNVSSSELQRLSEDKFECAMLLGKKANIRNDIPNTKLTTTGMIKNLLGADKITAQRKHERQFQFYPTAKLIFSCNELPEVADDTSAWWNKVILLHFDKQFNNDSEIIDKLMTAEELSGLLNFAIEGLHRLFENHKFTYNHITTQQRWTAIRKIKSTNPILDFYKANVIEDITQHITKSDLYDAYLTYCEGLNIPFVSKNMFGRLINNLKVEEGRLTNKITNKDIEVWKNIKLKDNTQTLVEDDSNRIVNHPYELETMFKTKGK